MLWRKHTPLYEKAQKKTKNIPMETTILNYIWVSFNDNKLWISKNTRNGQFDKIIWGVLKKNIFNEKLKNMFDYGTNGTFRI